MLKIKDNVDLKELEKFGFDLELNIADDYDQIYCFDSRLMFDKIDKNIIIPMYNEGTALDTLYDLIKADLVEKVEDK